MSQRAHWPARPAAPAAVALAMLLGCKGETGFLNLNVTPDELPPDDTAAKVVLTGEDEKGRTFEGRAKLTADCGTLDGADAVAGLDVWMSGGEGEADYRCSRNEFDCCTRTVGLHATFDRWSASGDVKLDCSLEDNTAALAPLDIYIMLDQSGSMIEDVGGGMTKWGSVATAIESFLGQKQLGGVSVGLQYFPLRASYVCATANCTTDADCGANCGPCVAGYGCAGLSGDSCTPADYAKPAVEIAPWPGVTKPITDSMSMHSPGSSTPTSAALQGAVDHALDWAKTHGGHQVIVLFATDGEPTECDTDMPHIEAIAAAAASGTPRLLTFVIGVGDALDSLNGIAAAGGTQKAYVVSTHGGATVSQFLATLNQIRFNVAGCKFSVPTPRSGTFQKNLLNLRYAPAQGETSIIPMAAGAPACPSSGLAWYYDDPQNPSRIILCDGLCTSLQNDPSAVIKYELGCPTITL